MATTVQNVILPVRASRVQKSNNARKTVAAAQRQVANKPFLGAHGPSLRVAGPTVQARRSLVVRAEEGGFDALLSKGAEKWEAAENKPVVVGYGVGFIVALIVIEKIIHLPLLNILLGFPLELLGVCSAGILGYRYIKEGGDPIDDLEGTLSKVTAELPGLKKD
mmetsp:Transcript_21010/g.25226  ORF Transcript_21010/g.25226 Transcript_21010/m.25226 type:complete len:164 (+) Transcript_21010:61-552(+)|eukprot:CAMPEP_0197846720 /NCGR_PEP_ID=MMETSP1438-20131217/4141_1 /TAXON_ID=1461541 /ORGANISM="Pterosperma sp., Strain CCMP1384" /LENGTH=163 /DNA_ID=CAMNT_0043458463 /DNA_START=56 /DNA_END=547 /DNA_ORIENTATION=+